MAKSPGVAVRLSLTGDQPGEWDPWGFANKAEDENNSQKTRGRDSIAQEGSRDWPSCWTWVGCLTRATLVQTVDDGKMLVWGSLVYRFGAVEAGRKSHPP